MSEPKLFLDMDGVLSDFLGGIYRVHNRTSPYNQPESKGQWHLEQIWGMTPAEFYRPTMYDGFWANLSKTAEADWLVSESVRVFGVENVAILTAPSDDYRCIPEKKEWIARYYPFLSKQIIFTKAKQFLASPRSLLIDDKDENCDIFDENDGRSILVPRDWNSRWMMADRVKEIVKEGLDYFNDI